MRVLSTVIQIIKDFTMQKPHVKLIFMGSTEDRTKLYARILKRYLEDFRKDFIITAFIARSNFYEEVIFQPQNAFAYSAFFIKRID